MVLTVDENSPSDLKKAITRLQKRRKTLLRSLGYEAVSFQGSRVNAASVLPELENMLALDLSTIYGVSSADRSYYVYVHCDPTKGLDVRNNLKHLLLASKFGLKHEPFYVGKGTGNRAEELSRNDGHRKIRARLTQLGKEVEVVRIAVDLSEEESLALESKFIDILGIRSFGQNGILVNLDEGTKVQERRRLYSAQGRAILRKNGFLAPNSEKVTGLGGLNSAASYRTNTKEGNQ